MVDEEIQDLEDKVARGRKMHAMTQAEAWNDLFMPYLEGARAGAMKALLGEKGLEGFLCHSQAYRTITGIINYVHNIIDIGEAAKEQLKKKDEEEEVL